jgi:hypothetical protein
MKPLVTIQFETDTDLPREAAPIMARVLEAVAAAIRVGDAAGQVTGRGVQATWVIETEITIDEIRAALNRLD